MMKGYLLLAAMILLIAFWFWFRCVEDLINRSDEDFPGRNDKIVWALILIFLNVVGAVLYSLRKRVDKEARQRAAYLEKMLRADPDAKGLVECPECDKPMPATADKCPSCGWQYFEKQGS